MLSGISLVSVLVVLCLYIVTNCDAYLVTVDAHAEECFFERVSAGAKLGLTFEVSEGGFLDIGLRIVGPDGKTLYEGERESSGKYTFAAEQAGMYTYCFSNKMSTLTPKVAMFNMEVSEPSEGIDAHKPENTEEENLEAVIKQISSMLISVKHEQEYMSVRDRIHRSISESTNSRVVLWAVFEAVVIISVVIGEIWYLKRFFEVRRIV